MNLNTQQIVLLCLLVSFVTSIATGITVVSLMQQAPEPVSQTINRVIERTVETVAQKPVEEIKNIISQKPSNNTKEVVTVVVNQEEQSINAVAKNEKSIARIVVNNRNEDFITLGVVYNQAGDILVDKRMVDKRSTYGAYIDGKKYLVKYTYNTETNDFALMKIQGENPNNFTPASFGDSNNLKLAQSVISLSGSKQTSVTTGEIELLNKTADGSLISIDTSVNGQNVLNGSVLLNLSGDIVGIKVFTTEDRTVFMPINTLKAQIAPAPAV
jgi:S1-C subfamily serine protease